MSNCFKLEHLGALILAGPDAVAYAQAQFTNDIAAIDSAHWFPAAWCDPKGRVVSVMLASRSEESVELVVPAWQIDTLTERLKMYAIGRDVHFSSGSGVCGCRNAGKRSAILSYDNRRSLRIDHGDCSHDDHEQARWQHDDLEARFPWLSPDSAGRHLPQSLGLEALGGLSYSKGCFPGQEVIARVHYRGKVGYRVARIQFDAGSAPPGTPLRLEDGRRIGEMLWSLSSGHGSRGLAVVSIDTDDGAEILAESGDDGLSGQVSL
jgi:tRNA-modifying protein YgfZ